MNFDHFFSVVDTHTCGDPTRTLIGGISPISGETIEQKMFYLKKEKDWIRRTLMFEPRGNEVQAGAILTEPCSEEADIGVIYTEVDGYLYMCGHNTIGVGTALVETGIIESEEPFTYINLETPAGVVKLKIKVRDGSAKEVTFQNVPSFVFERDVLIKCPPYGEFKIDISYGGLFYAIVDGRKLDFDIIPKNYNTIVDFARAVRTEVNRKIEVSHPEKPFINEVEMVLISAPPTRSDADMKNVNIIPYNAVSRSPCGTGTSAKLALLYESGEKAMEDEFVHEGAITNTIFKARVVQETKVGNFKAIIPEVTGSAYITGFHTFVTDPDDPLKHGFSLA